MITYGIFRNGYNNWAIKASKEWLFKYKIRIDEKESDISTTKTTRQKKGFVYTNLVQRASNSIADRVQKNMIVMVIILLFEKKHLVKIILNTGMKKKL